MKLAREFKLSQFAESRAETDLVFVVERLPAKKNHLVLVEGRAYLRKRCVIERLRQIRADDFGAERGAGGLDLNGHEQNFAGERATLMPDCAQRLQEFRI